jgi:hypothetical protein
MNTFVNAVQNQEARTENGMKARKNTKNAVVDLFYKIGGSRGKNIIPDFSAALVENPELAIRVALWARDVRGGAGEREIFRQILKYLETSNPVLVEMVLPKVPELGRWDDLLEFNTNEFKVKAFDVIGDALRSKNGLCAKWMPRKGQLAVELRNALGMSPKQYRKTLVNLTKVVESQMCAKDWNNINFSHVPSLATSRYKKAFYRNAAEKYAEYVASLVKGDDPKVKVNAGAVYPYDVLKGVINTFGYNTAGFNKTQLDLVIKQWEALPNYVGDASILPLVDVSGSMTCKAGGHSSKSQTTCLDVAISLGLYLAEKNTGVFKDTFLTFSGSPELLHLKGNVVEKSVQMVRSTWAMNTNLHAAMQKILQTAKNGNVPQEDMPKMLLILSDMQFDACTRFDDSAQEMIARKFEEAGYDVPLIVFWNLNASSNAPVKYDTRGVALVSGFSPSIVKAVLSAEMDNFTPEGIMMKTIMNERYSF